MIKIKPVNELVASESITLIYNEIKLGFNANTVPMFFRYLANSSELLRYAWQIIGPVLRNSDFLNASKRMQDLAKEMMEIIYIPSAKVLIYLKNINKEENKSLLHSVTELNRINASLLLITIAIREALKGLGIKEADFSPELKQVHSSSLESNTDKIYEEFTLEELDKNLSTVVKYPDFYELIAKDMFLLMQTEKYLKVRVEFERIVQMLLEQMPVKINLTYKETMEILTKSKEARDLIYLIYSVFPSQSPHSLLTSSGMEQALKPNLNIELV